MIKSLYYVIHLLIKENENMEPTSKKEPSENLTGKLVDLQKTSSIVKWRDSAFTAAVDKFVKTNNKAETVMQTGEAFGRGLFTELLGHTAKQWTIKQWLDITTSQVLTPIGTPLKCTTLTQEAAVSTVQKNISMETSQQEISSLFTFGLLRGLFLSAFPDGELLLENIEAADLSQTQVIFKTHASFKDKFERERVKHVFTSMKKV